MFYFSIFEFNGIDCFITNQIVVPFMWIILDAVVISGVWKGAIHFKFKGRN